MLNIDLPAGTLVAKGTMSGDGRDADHMECRLINGAAELDRAEVMARDHDGDIPFSLVSMVTLPAAGSVELVCETFDGTGTLLVLDSRILATAVQSF